MSVEIIFNPPAKVLVVDDSKLNRTFVGSTFTEPNFILEEAVNGYEGIEKANSFKPELILLDVMMPELDGYQAAKKLKENTETADIPIIFITALDSVKDKLAAFNAGGVDFITKPFNHQEITARACTQIKINRSIEENKRMQNIISKRKQDDALSKVAAGVSHNFNNMIGVALGNIMLVESMGDMDEMSADSVADVKDSLNRMQRLTRQFLHLSNHSNELQGGIPMHESFEIKSTIDEVINKIKITKPEILIENATSANSTIFFDKKQFIEVIDSIFNEVLEITANKAKISILNRKVKNKEICLIKVSNMNAFINDVSYIFEPFALPITNVGTGLALPVAKHILKLNKSTINANSKEDGTINFTITLPTK